MTATLLDASVLLRLTAVVTGLIVLVPQRWKESEIGERKDSFNLSRLWRRGMIRDRQMAKARNNARHGFPCIHKGPVYFHRLNIQYYLKKNHSAVPL
jgi:hypothetical protein